ncbi:MAG: chemotaxis protein CheA [Clostridia bacterium]|nr:chemotaxis protein CheA [Clostridia bacterium]MDD4145758.1 chemotaxis protein CheA [Clostridia bacterium]MDD4665399.1 chemotaxis protein CheA [Clostridia bacterium]
MGNQSDNDSLLEMFVFETTQYLERLEELILSNEKSNCYTQTVIGEIFRIMHNIKSSSAMMLLTDISKLAHAMEDFFFFVREEKPKGIDYSVLSDFILEGVDFIKVELQKIKNGDTTDGDPAPLIKNIKEYLVLIKKQNNSTKLMRAKKTTKEQQSDDLRQEQKTLLPEANAFKAVIYFQEGCEMENIRAYQVVHQLKGLASEIYYLPDDLVENNDSVQIIREQGFEVFFKSEQTYQQILAFCNQNILFKELELIQLENDDEFKQFTISDKVDLDKVNKIKLEEFSAEMPQLQEKTSEKDVSLVIRQSIIGVNVDKLDKLMDLVGEMVIAEAMVTQHPELKGLELDNFNKAARQLRKIINEVQNFVMSMRMVPLVTTFQKMYRVVRDMSKKLNKEVELEIIGGETEVDKNIIEHVSDPLLHLVRNAIDHGLESPAERRKKGKAEAGKITLEARSAGNDVLIVVRDNGKGLNKEKLMKQAKKKGLLRKQEHEMTEREIYNLILVPGFSTKEQTTEFSGRGVGMDVVTNNVEKMGGDVLVDSVPDEGTTITLKIPLTLTIIDGMNISVGEACYTIPINTIKECFKPKETEIIMDLDGNEMIMVRGQCFPIVRLYQLYQVKTEITCLTDGILMMVENNEKMLCLFVDKLLGEQQVVVKTLPSFIGSTIKKKGLVGCTLLGDGSISLILDVAGFF